MQQILVSPVPDFIYTTTFERFFNSTLFTDILNTSITLGALGFAFYMFYNLSKYGRYGRDVSKENQEHDKESLIDHGLIDPAKPESNKNKIAVNRTTVNKEKIKQENKRASEL